MGTIIVTGGAGFIGSNLVRRMLVHTRDRVVVLDKLTYAGHAESLPADARVLLVRGDLADRAAVRGVFRDFEPWAVLNLAAETHVDRSIDGPEPFVRTNLLGTFELLEAARLWLAERRGEQRRRFRLLHVSTDEVYGSLGDAGVFTEQTPYAPRSPYAASKAGADHLVRAYGATYGLPVLLTNASNNYGPYQFPEKLVPLTILNAIEGRPLPVYGDGRNVRDWLFVEDHCAALLDVLESGRPGRRYNVGARCERSNLEMVCAICEALEVERPASRNPALQSRGIGRYIELVTLVADRPGHDYRYAVDPARLEGELGWRPAHRFEEGVRETVRWYLAHLEWCRSVQSGHDARQRLGLPSRRRSA